MSQYLLKDKAIDTYDLQKSKLLTSFECHVEIKNFGENFQPKYSRLRKTIFLADTAKSRQMCQVLGYLFTKNSAVSDGMSDTCGMGVDAGASTSQKTSVGKEVKT
jgi:hypothetical protein